MIKPWREIIVPNKDVADGKYQQAEFAADLAQVLSGKADPEYQDPIEFFNRTYLTKGMKYSIESALRRISNKGGEPVVQLKISFGGGKTHTEIALYHLFKNHGLENHPIIKKFLEEIKITKIPKANIAVLVGTALNPAEPKLIPGFKTGINTLWGYMAYQLGKEDAFNIIEKADSKSVSPGADTLLEIFDRFGPCVILIDELVAYARNIYNVQGLPSGTFDTLMTFVQSLTEAIKRSKNSIIIASIPESRKLQDRKLQEEENIEIGGEAGRLTLERIEKVFGRLEVIWRPVEANESFEIVRRRLFEQISDQKDKEDVCKLFSKFYKDENIHFPNECKEAAYLERLKETYPIHPEIFDRLYGDWSTLERFQRTRGVLRFNAAVIHQLWISGDKSLMIMPGNISMDSQKVRDELTRYLSDEWNSIVDNDVDGDRSEPKKIDEGNNRYGKIQAARRIARTIFLGSAPSSREQKNRGIEEPRILLGAAQPGDNIAVLKDALSTLSQKLTYMYYQGNRYWYDSHPNLIKTAEDRAIRLYEEEVFSEIRNRLEKIKIKGEFEGIHICPESEDIPDDDNIRLIILSPKQTYKKGDELNEAIMKSKIILETRGNIPRHYQNMLIFISADDNTIIHLNKDIRNYLAWESVLKDQEVLNLDAYQKKQAEENKKYNDTKAKSTLNDAYSWLLIPFQESINPSTILPIRIKGRDNHFIVKASKQAIEDGYIVTKLSPILLIKELDVLWKDKEYINTKQLWEYLSRYLYLPRLRDKSILIDCIREGIKNKEFGYASNIDKSGKFVGLEFGSMAINIVIDEESILLKKEVASKQIGRKESPIVDRPLVGKGHTILQENIFRGRVDLDPNRLSRDAGKIFEEVIQHILFLSESKISISLEITAEVPSGIPENIKNILNENCKSLGFIFDFE